MFGCQENLKRTIKKIKTQIGVINFSSFLSVFSIDFLATKQWLDKKKKKKKSVDVGGGEVDIYSYQ
jgi:predicted DNA-binding ribbon-helix-helix protein